MPSAHVVAVEAVERTPRVIQVEGMFDVPPMKRQERKWDVELDLEDEEWQVGLIVGPSGAGKTRVARALWPDAIVAGFEWSETQSLLDAFPDVGIKKITGTLAGVGLGSIPAWLRPYHSLSTGEQFRATMARALVEAGEQLVVVDEFTSTVDRQVAKVASHAVAKHVRRGKGKLICVTCHYDVVDWLNPDWVYQPHLNEFARRRLRRRPALDLEIAPVNRRSWRAFRHHHYLSSKLHPHAKCVGGFIDGECVAFCSWMHFMHPHAKNVMKGHRLVVLPDWQGLGLAGHIIDWLGQYLWDQGLRFHVTAAHPALIAYCRRSPRWQKLNRVTQLRTGPSALTPWRSSEPRILGLLSFRYMPPAKDALQLTARASAEREAIDV